MPSGRGRTGTIMTECFAHSRNQTPPGVTLEVLPLSMASIKNSYCATIPWLPPKPIFLRCSMVAATALVGEYSRTAEFTFACSLTCFISGILENRVFGLPWPQEKSCYVVSYHSRHYRLSCRCALTFFQGGSSQIGDSATHLFLWDAWKLTESLLANLKLITASISLASFL